MRSIKAIVRRPRVNFRLPAGATTALGRKRAERTVKDIRSALIATPAEL